MTIFRFCVSTRLVSGRCGVTSRIWDGSRLSSSSSESSNGSSSSSDSEDEKPTKKAKPTSTPVSAQALVQQILSMKIDGSKLTGGSNSEVNIAQPSGKWRKIKEELKRQPETPKLDRDLVSAVKDVADSLGGDTSKIESELLRKLKDHDSSAREMKSMSEIFSGMKIQRTQKKAEVRGQIATEEDGLTAHMIAISAKKMWSVTDQEADSASQRVSVSRSMMSRDIPHSPRSSGSDIFGAQPLNIFNREISASSDKPKMDFPKLATWDKLEVKSLKLSATHPPTNGFEEMIQWTEQGKLWKFPIDNEQGMEKEASIGFHEHVFLEKHISDFPRKGPIRHFMELVLVGLSKNPYFSVEQKAEHIDWFRQYFKKHETLLKEIGALG